VSVRYLVADVGATWARFGLADEAGVGDRWVTRLDQYRSSDALVEAAIAQFGSPVIAAACLAVAGPESEGRVGITNAAYEFAIADLERAVGAPVRLVNDFFALAHAVPELTELDSIGGHRSREGGVKALIGPGTGLGMAVLVPSAAGYMVVASEGGHADLAPGSPLEQELLAVLARRHAHVSWETAVSGAGLVRLYEAVAELWGVTPPTRSAEQISAAGAQADDPLCHQTLELFCALLGAAAGNLAVTVCATGGVYLAGGILPRLGAFLAASPFRRRFEERGRLSALVRPIPVYLIRDEQPGLLGALRCLQAAPPVRQIVHTDSRA
jgi:glucokinase